MPFAIYFDAKDLREDRVEELVAWLRSLGLVPEHFRSRGAIFQGEVSYELHLSEVVRNEDGNAIVDHALNSIVSKPIVTDLGPARTWPAWLGKDTLAD